MAGSRSVCVPAPAKINLYLGVHTEKDARGYHRVDSVMSAVGLCDSVRITESDKLEVRMVPEADFPMQSNAAYKAAAALGEAFGREPNFRIEIEKRIPIQAGLGGPSTDAAAAIKGICELWGEDPTSEQAVRVAKSIGADVPFFLYGAPAYLAGAGDDLKEVFAPLADVPVVLVKPNDASVPTPEAYKCFDENPIACKPMESMLQALRSGSSEDALANTFNNLAPIAEQIAPEITKVLTWLRAQEGTKAVGVCGSGACCYAICNSKETADKLAEEARQQTWWSQATKLK